MKLTSIDAGNFKLDGGAMFGVVPKSIWQKTNPADENNLCSWAMRCLLVEVGNRLVLIDTGMGNKQSEKWLGYYFRHGEGDLVKSINKAGYAIDQVTDVIFSHLHFDHCGGGVIRKANETFQPLFEKAKYWTHSEHWSLANNPNPREKATFLQENFASILANNQLSFIDQANDLPTEIEYLYGDGHTEKMIMPLIHFGSQKILFVADTIPSSSHLPLPYVMGYDTQPLKTMAEKQEILERANKEHWVLFFDHDPVHEACTVMHTEKGIRLDQSVKISDL